MSPSEAIAAGPSLTEEQLKLVEETLQAVLTSHHFQKSKRYPAFLKFVVRAALDDSSYPVKERSVGIEVFGRSTDYNTGNDPVVRIAAGEVRRRMAVYFSEHPEAPVRIDLPIGSYKAEFHFRSHHAIETASAMAVSSTLEVDFVELPLHPQAEAAPQTLTGDAELNYADSPLLPSLPVSAPPVPPTRHSVRPQVVLVAVLLLIAASIGLWRYQRNRGLDEFWEPVFQGGSQPLILMGKTNPAPIPSTQTGQPAAGTYGTGASTTLVLDDALTAARVCSIFREFGHDCPMEPGKLADGEELRNRSFVVVGGLGSSWTQQLLAPLLYHPVTGTLFQPDAKGTVLIMKHQPGGDALMWKFNKDAPPAQFGKDYAIVARYRNETTGGLAVIVAGLGPQGTIEAGQFVSSSESLRTLLSHAPKGWAGTNFEAILEIDLVQGTGSGAKVIATNFW